MPVLAAVDGSERSWTILPHAVALANVLGVPIQVVRILNPLLDVGDEFGPSISEAAENVAERWDADLSQRLRELGVTAETKVVTVERRESITDAILRVARASNAHVTAMSSRGAGAIRHAFLGSVALEVLGKSSSPVLLGGPELRPPPEYPTYRAVITSDASPAARASVATFASLFDEAEAEAALLGIYSPAFGDRDPMKEMADARTHLEELRDLFAEQLHLHTHVFDAAGYESTAHAIVRSAEELQASVIAMATHGHSALRHLVAGSTAMGALKQSPLPLLLLPAD